MQDDLTELQGSLELIKKTVENLEYWSARDLMTRLGYSTWESFKTAINRAQESCQQTGQSVEDHFRGVTKMVDLGSGSQRGIEDFLLTRYACYLVAQNGDPRKPKIAAAQRYFAIQTRRQEVWEQRAIENKRLEERGKLRDTEKKIERTVYQRGITQSIEFATFKNKHIEALYGGINTPDLKRKRGISKDRALADFDTDVELKAKNFALGMTDHNISTKNLTGRDKLEQEVVANSSATRDALLARGITPEELEPAEDIKKIEKRRAKEQQAIAAVFQQALDKPSDQSILSLNRFNTVEHERNRAEEPLIIRIPKGTTVTILSKLNKFLRSNPGTTQVILEISQGDGVRTISLPNQVRVTKNLEDNIREILSV